MKEIIKDIWIQAESGIVVFHESFTKSGVDEQLFGMLMSALNSFAEELSKGGLSSFEIQEQRFYISKRHCFNFITSSSIDVKEKAVNKEIERLMDRFFKMYPKDILNDWNGDISIFSGFRQEIEQMKKRLVDNFLLAL